MNIQGIAIAMEKLLRKLVKLNVCLYYRLTFKAGKKNNYIPASGKMLDEKELLNMIDASLDMWLTSGRFNDEFEKKFAEFLGAKHCLTANSGSSANLLALTALTSQKLGDKSLKKGDEIITTAAGFPTTINPIIQNGLVPVFVDSEIGSYNIHVNQIEESISSKTRGIMIAHTLGNVFDIGKIKELSEKYNLWLIEDSCDALGAKYKNKFSGTIGHIGTFSFYPAHHITMGEGGALVTNDSQLYHIIMSFRDWGRDCWCPPGKDATCKNRFNWQFGNLPFGYDHKYTYSHLGYNLKITDWQAACGLAQLDKLNGFIEKRTRNFKLIYDGLKKYEDYLILPTFPVDSTPSWFGFLISVKPNDKFNRLELVKYLESNNIGTRLLFAGNILRQPAFVENDVKIKIKNSEILNSKNLTEEHYKMLPNADFIMNNTFWIGVYPGISEKDINKIINVFDNFFKR
jgi:CDP-6-deoxy-D-xylo-4-hexulose-3-dehydrase